MSKQSEALALRRPNCYACPSKLHYAESIPKKQFGVMMHMGDTFCVHQKKAHHFKVRELNSVPAWCPKSKSPRELRVYALKDTQAWFMHQQLCAALGRDISPESHRYALLYELHTELTAKDFWTQCPQHTASNLIGVAVHRYDVVEIDDGLKPVFFYKTADGYDIAPFFTADVARKNRVERCE